MMQNFQSAVVAEWLRRLTRNQMGYARAGSNPAACGNFFWIKFEIEVYSKNYDWIDLEGIRLFFRSVFLLK